MGWKKVEVREQRVEFVVRALGGRDPLRRVAHPFLDQPIRLGAPSLNRSLIQGWESTNPNEPGGPGLAFET